MKRKTIALLIVAVITITSCDGLFKKEPDKPVVIRLPQTSTTDKKTTTENQNLLHEGNYVYDRSVDVYSGTVVNYEPTHYHLKIFKQSIGYNSVESSNSSSQFVLAKFDHEKDGTRVYVNNWGGIGEGTYYVDEYYNIKWVKSSGAWLLETYFYKE